MKKIMASEGMYLTQKNIDNAGGRVFAVSLYLADNDTADNWREATMDEYWEWQKRMDERAEEGMAGSAANSGGSDGTAAAKEADASADGTGAGAKE